MLNRESRQIFDEIERIVATCPRAELDRGVHRLKVKAAGPAGFDMSIAVDCLGVNADDSPKHPLYVSAKTPLQPYLG